MPAVDLRGILFRAFFPDIDEDTEVYDPIGPDDYTPTDGALHLSGIKFRSYSEDEEEE